MKAWAIGMGSEENIGPSNGWRTFAKIRVSKDRLQAFLTIDPAAPDEYVGNADALRSFLAAEGIVYGWKEEWFGQLDLPKGEAILVAEGTPPQPGEDGHLEILLSETSGRIPREMPDGSVDPHDLGGIEMVFRGQLLAKVYPPRPGKSGTGVDGQEIPPAKPREAKFQLGKNVCLNEKGDEIIAAIDGHALFDKRSNTIEVSDVYVVPGDVDFSVGNIDFVGSIVINGNVLPGFHVRAKGAIEVKGYVDSAFLNAEQDIVIKGGVFGSSGGAITAGQSLYALFIQNATVSVQGDCVVQRGIMQSRIHAGRSVIVAGRKSSISGGTVYASESLVVGTLGSPMGAHTVVALGAKPELRAELEAVTLQLKRLEEEKAKMETALLMLEKLIHQQGSLPKDKEELRHKMEAAVEDHKRYIAALQSRATEIRVELANYRHLHVVVHDTVYPGVSIVLGDHHHEVRDAFRHVKFVYLDGTVQAVPL